MTGSIATQTANVTATPGRKPSVRVPDARFPLTSPIQAHCLALFVGQSDPQRRMIARLVASADSTIDVGPGQARRQRRTDEKMVDAKPRVALKGIPEVLPE